jgi:hypothetical protein
MTTSTRRTVLALPCAMLAPLLVLTAGCVGVAPVSEDARPQVVTTQSATTPPAVPAPTARSATPLTLDLNALEAQLEATTAIGVLTKISLRNQVDDLKQKFREYHEGRSVRTITDLRRSYGLLLMKMLSLLQDTDQMLASNIVSSREAIWGLLSDRSKFANL